jgi:hypothetical protein
MNGCGNFYLCDGWGAASIGAVDPGAFAAGGNTTENVMTDLLVANLLSPLVLAFALGIAARVMRSDLSLPKDIYTGLSIYLLFALGLKGGVELSKTSWEAIALPAAVTLLLGVATPLTAYTVLRRVGRLGIADSAGIAAHYGSVSAVTFIAAQQFVERVGVPAEGFMPTLLTLLEVPGIQVALGLGVVQLARQRAAAAEEARAAGRPAVALAAAGGGAGVALAEAPAPALHVVGGGTGTHGSGEGGDWREALREVLFGRTMFLLVGGMAIGAAMGTRGWEPVKPFFEGGFKGALTLFLLEMGILAAARLGDLRKVGLFLLGFGIGMPIVHGLAGVALAHWAGLGVGGATVLGAMAASASYIAAPPAVRTTLPDASPTLYLTSALAITFPFNLLLGIPLYFGFARLLAGG